MDESVNRVSFEKSLSTIMHALDEVKFKVININYVKVWFLLLTK
jgi:hypothetical protein